MHTDSNTDSAHALTDNMHQYQTRIAEQLALILPNVEHSPCRLHRAMHYAVFNGGKRLRPILVYATGIALGLPLQSLDPAAAAIELIHCYSLVHDDLPAMDNDDWRRGQPSCHKAFDGATALLAGNALLTLAFDLCARDTVGTNAEQRLAVILQLTRAIGSNGLIGGQALEFDADIRADLPNHLNDIQRKKTGALIHAAVMLPTLLCKNITTEKQTALSQFGHALGLAFQIRDDLLDLTADQSATAPDAINFAHLFGSDQAIEKIDDLHKQAHRALATFGNEMNFLRELTDFLTSRMV
jgi:geranylgeranyl pyrophosphate synthase